MKGFSEIYPDEYKELRDDEERLGFTLDNKKNLDDFICGAKSCLCLDDKQAVHSIKTGEFTVDDIFVDDWKYPVGAFHGSDAFLFESGLGADSWGINEEIVDWIAYQFPKMAEAFGKVDAL